jgi:hypothetical protein
MEYVMDKIRRIVILERALYEQIRRIAQREHRSLSAQVVHWLEEALARDRASHAADAEADP